MAPVNTVSVLVGLAALFSYVNHRHLKLPPAIGLMALALAMSLGMALAGRFEPRLGGGVQLFIHGIDFNQALMSWMLSFLLFAGALEVNLGELLEQKWVVGSLSSVAVLVSTGIIGYASRFLFGLLGVKLSLVSALLFGALISPTDPVAVLGIAREAGMKRSLQVTIEGESLLNDGVGVAIFLVILGLAAGGRPTFAGASWLFLQEAAGGATVGVATGLVAYRMMKAIDQSQVEILITLALAMGTYAAASALHTSGPLAVVAAGLFIGNRGRRFAMSEETREHLDHFWQLVDVLLNAILFLLIGLEMLVLDIQWKYLAAGLVAIPVALVARYISATLPLRLLHRQGTWREKTSLILTWGGLRGGLAIAMALSLPPDGSRDAIITITYVVVVFSILVQGLTLGRLVRSVPAEVLATEPAKSAR